MYKFTVAEDDEEHEENEVECTPAIDVGAAHVDAVVHHLVPVLAGEDLLMWREWNYWRLRFGTTSNSDIHSFRRILACEERSSTRFRSLGRWSESQPPE